MRNEKIHVSLISSTSSEIVVGGKINKSFQVRALKIWFNSVSNQIKISWRKQYLTGWSERCWHCSINVEIVCMQKQILIKSINFTQVNIWSGVHSRAFELIFQLAAVKRRCNEWKSVRIISLSWLLWVQFNYYRWDGKGALIKKLIL